MRTVYGVGINDADYVVSPSVNGVQVWCPAYSVWKAMIKRCYSDRYKQKNKKHIGVKVCDEWLSFMGFRKWWVDNHVDGWKLNKCILSDDMIYSPETSIFVPSWIDEITHDINGRIGECRAGVCYHGASGKFQSQCHYPLKGQEYIGLFDTEEEAYAESMKRKLEITIELKPKMDEIDARIFQRVIELITR